MSSPDRAHANGSAAGEDAAGPAAFTRREILGGRAADQQDKGHPLTFRPSDAERNVVHPVPSAMIADYRHADPGAHIAARTDEEIATLDTTIEQVVAATMKRKRENGVMWYR